jgi:hypothetical protein
MTGSEAIQLVSEIATVVVSISGAAFVSGTRWGRVEQDMKTMSDRLARIEGMFTLKLRDRGD